MTSLVSVKFSDVTKDQKEAVALLSIGTLLEFFDVTLYVHMAVLLNELFFPSAEPWMKTFGSAIAVCNTAIFRPFGAIFFGYVGDLVGRKAAIIISTLLTALCSLSLALLPTYAQIGIAAPIILTICRALQGMSASAEANGVELYITETVSPPAQYPLVATVSIFAFLGGVIALGLAVICTSPNLLPTQWSKQAWRFAFIVGTVVGVIGAVARTSLKEAGEFANRQKLLKQHHKDIHVKMLNVKPSLLTSLAYFFIHCGRGPFVYFIFFCCGDILKNTFGFTSAEVISRNFKISLVQVSALVVVTFLSYRIHPFKIVKFRLVLCAVLLSLFPLVMQMHPSSNTLLVFQCALALMMVDHVPAGPIFFKYFPVSMRFRYTGILASVAGIATYVTTAFGLTWSLKHFGYVSVIGVLGPIWLAFFFSVRYFEKKEQKQNNTLSFASRM